MKTYEGSADLFIDGELVAADSFVNVTQSSARVPEQSAEELIASIRIAVERCGSPQPANERVVRCEVPSEVWSALREQSVSVGGAMAHAFIGATLDGIPTEINGELPVRSVRWTFADGSTRIDRW